MKIIDRYVGLQVVVTTLFGVVVLSLVLVLGNLFKEVLDLIINHEVPIRFVLLFMAYVLPFSLTFTIPWGFLTALLLIFGRMSADNELIALRANGVSVPRLCVPVFILAVLLTSFCFWINIEVAPRAEQAMARMIFQIATSNPMAMFTADETIDQFPDRRIYIGDKEGDRMRNILVFELNEKDALVKVVKAQEGELTADPENRRLNLKLFDAVFEQRNEDDPKDITQIRQGIVMREGVFPLTLDALYEEAEVGRRLSSYTLQQLGQRLGEEGPNERELEMRVEFNKRFSASLACLAFAIVAIPLGVTAHRKETSIGFAISLAIAFFYFFFIIIADTFKNNAAAQPVLLIWLPNIIFITLGSVLFYRLSRR